ncbi:Septum formation initiator [Fusobacterium necrogenes]|uniref:Septum formation initiator n=1 Tax=Fusobacterium necrogenes TaxID=858 RepID=A0A377GVM5_9FUSO|nr:septum formation initiator family protein [Fusobacterium necrogenes]STO30996.1 Septum formation initiator [Fusobacterium necrogenes]
MQENKVGKILSYIIILLNLYFFVPYMYRSYIKIEKLKREQLEIKEKIKIVKKKIEDYNIRIEKLGDDFQREKIARDRLQMVKENEEIYRFIDK